jgi:hypothetical protein
MDTDKNAFTLCEQPADFNAGRKSQINDPCHAIRHWTSSIFNLGHRAIRLPAILYQSTE